MGFRLDPETEARALALAGVPAVAAGESEAAFQARVMRYARRRGWLAYHAHDSRRSEPGFPDLVLVRDRVLFVELKTQSGLLRESQAAWLDRLAAAGRGPGSTRHDEESRRGRGSPVAVARRRPAGTGMTGQAGPYPPPEPDLTPPRQPT